MSRVYFEGWYSGAYVKAEDWYKDDLVYINVRLYWESTAVSRPDKEKSFLVRFNDREQIHEWQHTIAAIFPAGTKPGTTRAALFRASAACRIHSLRTSPLLTDRRE